MGTTPDAAYGPLLTPLPSLRKELAERETFGTEKPPEGKEEKRKFREEKKANIERLRDLKRELKALEKLEAEAEEKRAAAREHAERQMALAREAAADLLRICADPAEARRYFVVTERAEIEENEFNLNIPRYVDTFEPESLISVDDALKEDAAAMSQLTAQTEKLHKSDTPRRAGGLMSGAASKAVAQLVLASR